MTFPRFWSMLAAVCLLGFQFSAPVRAHADTYNIVGLANDNVGFLGMDDNGHVVFDKSNLCGFACYETYTNGGSAVQTNTIPPFSFDFAKVPCNASPCSVSLNGRTASFLNGSQLFVTAGANPPQLLTQFIGIAGFLAIDGVGDIVFDNGNADRWYEAINVSAAPEPSSLIFLATGLAAGAGLVRRKLAI